MIDTGRTDYQATYRRSERAIPGVLLVVALFAAALAAVLGYADSRDWEMLIIALAGVAVAALLLILAATFWLPGSGDTRGESKAACQPAPQMFQHSLCRAVGNVCRLRCGINNPTIRHRTD